MLIHLKSLPTLGSGPYHNALTMRKLRHREAQFHKSAAVYGDSTPGTYLVGIMKGRGQTQQVVRIRATRQPHPVSGKLLMA